ncbi:alpha/beta hydrolase family protein [Actomonas aquatica]|uniref:Alpha/beta fold hydrolase n=1 Tax=Actomonas aquatica TaxID=2866162 RepID=A0ABZ1C967_9BACT|nr:alpha/beta fold hydrolase [Opitutus sp. WL0086]WRQ88244.1 alpha/beta fold hydrolase [Opitutus sp. WL0086]
MPLRPATLVSGLLASASLLLAQDIALPELKLPSIGAAPAVSSDRFVDLFRPAQTDLATLSPDGRHLAYTVREGSNIFVLVVATERLDQALAKVLVVDDATATPRFARNDENVPARINWMRWVDNERVVVETNSQTAVDARGSVPGVILTFKADGSDARVVLTSRDVPELLTDGTTSPDFSAARDRSMLTATVDDPYYNEGGTAAARAAAREEEPTIDGGLFSTSDSDRFILSLGQDSDVFDPETGFGTAWHSPSIFDLNRVDPGHVLVRTASGRRHALFDLDPVTSKVESIASYPVDEDRLQLLDQQGVPRISAPATTNFAFPHRLAVDRGAGFRDDSLAVMAGLPAGAFDSTPVTFFTERAIPIGFAENPALLYYASNVGRDVFGIYALDLDTGAPTDFAIEHPSLDLIPRPLDAFLPPGTLVFDRYTRALKGVRISDQRRSTLWLDPILQASQSALERVLPGRNVEIVEWDQAGRTLLVFANSVAGPGRFYLFDRTSGKLSEFAQRAPWLNSLASNRVIAFTVTADGHDIECQLTLPQDPRVMPAPLIVVCPSQPWERVQPDFQPEIQALARMGFGVVQLSARGAWGHGIKAREAIHEGYDAAQINDLLAVIDQVGQSFNLNIKRVGLVGSGWGGYVALRAAALHPDRFRCTVTLEPPIDLKAWLRREDWESRDPGTQLVRSYYGPQELLDAKQLEQDAKELSVPSLIFAFPGADEATWRRSTYSAAKNFARSIRDTSPESEFMDLSEDFANGLPLARSTTYARIEDFINTHVYNFGVDIGESVEVKEP